MRYTESSKRLSHLFNSIVGVVCDRCILIRGYIHTKMLFSSYVSFDTLQLNSPDERDSHCVYSNRVTIVLCLFLCLIGFQRHSSDCSGPKCTSGTHCIRYTGRADQDRLIHKANGTYIRTYVYVLSLCVCVCVVYTLCVVSTML